MLHGETNTTFSDEGFNVTIEALMDQSTKKNAVSVQCTLTIPYTNLSVDQTLYFDSGTNLFLDLTLFFTRVSKINQLVYTSIYLHIYSLNKYISRYFLFVSKHLFSIRS